MLLFLIECGIDEAATDDLDTDQRNGTLHSLGLAATEVIYTGTLVCRDTDGYAVDGADTAGLVFAGVAQDSADNASGADGDEDVPLYVSGEYRFTSQNLTAADVGKKLYLVDNETVALEEDTDVDNFVFVGWMAEYISATECWVRITPEWVQEPKVFTARAAGKNAAAIDLSTPAALYGGTDFYVTAVHSMEAYVTGTLATPTLLTLTTDYTLAAGVITQVGDKSADTLLITFSGYLR